MNIFMWNNPFTERHLQTISQLGISLIPPVTKKLACGDYGNGANLADLCFREACMQATNPWRKQFAYGSCQQRPPIY
jgi:phosphopantothenoylcysteine synthetase/decarboxylase